MTVKYALLLWGVYFLGQAMHALKRANLVIVSPKNRITTLWQFLLQQGPALTVRVFLASVLFWIWFDNPRFMSQALGRVGINVGFEFPLTPATSAIYGYVSDSLLDWMAAKFPFLQKELPESAAPPKP